MDFQNNGFLILVRKSDELFRNEYKKIADHLFR